MDPTLLLLRVAEDPRPHIEAAVGQSEVLAALDLAGGQTRIGWGPVIAAGLKTRPVSDRTGTWTRTTIRELHLGELVLYDVVARVGGEDDLVIGFRDIPEVEVAILPSEGVVRVAPAGTGLPAQVGKVQAIDPQPKKPFWEFGRRFVGDGLTARVGGELQRGFDPPERGRFHLRTDRATSVLRDPGFARARLGESTTAHVFAERDDRIRDPAGDWLGALGYDALFDLDIAISSDGIAWNPAQQVTWTDAGETLLDLEILGKDRSIRLWELGRTDEALAIDEDEVAGDAEDCMGWLVLGMRRLRAGHADPLVALDEGVSLFDAWASLDAKTRDRVRAGQSVPEGTGPVQPDGCAQATGRWLLARKASGEDLEALYDDAAAYAGDDSYSQLAAGIVARDVGDLDRAVAHLQNAWHAGVRSEVLLALATLHAERGRLDTAIAAYERLASDDPHPLVTAIAGYPHLYPTEDGPRHPGFLARQVVRAVHGESVDRDRLARDLERARWQTADAAWTLAATRALARLEGDDGPDLSRYEARSPDPWAARMLDPDPDVADMARAVLEARFPELMLPDVKPIGPPSVQQGEDSP